MASPDRNTKPHLDMLNFQGLATKLNPDLLEHNQLTVCQNVDFYHEFGSLRKMRGNSRKLSAVYTESGSPKPCAWIGFYKSQDFSGQLNRKVLAQLGTTIRVINTDGSTTAQPVGAVVGSESTALSQPNKLFRSHGLFDRLMLVTGQDPFKGGRRGTFFKYDGFRTSNWGVIAPGRQETIVQGFESTASFGLSGCTLSTEETIAYYLNSIKMLKTAGQPSCYMEILNQTAQAFGTTIEDRGELRIYIPQDEFRNLATSGRAISVYFGSDATFASNYHRYDFRVGELAPGWNTLVFDFSTVPTGNIGTSAGNLDETAVKSYRFEALFNTAGTAAAVDLYWDHLVALDTGTPTPTLSDQGDDETEFVASETSIWSYKVTFVNEFGTESNCGPQSVEVDLTDDADIETVMLDSFENGTTEYDGNDSGGTLAQGSGTNKTEGSFSIGISHTAGTLTSTFTNDTALNMDLTNARNDEIFIDVRIPTGTRVNLDPTAFTIEIGDDSSFSNKLVYYFDRDELEENGFTTLTMDVASPDDQVGDPDLSNMDFVRYTWTFIDTAVTSTTMYVDNLYKRVTKRYGSVTLTAIPTSTDPGVVARKLYRTVASGTEFLFLATINDNTTTTYTDTTIDTSLGVTTPPEIGFFNDNSPPPFGAIMKIWKRTVFMAGDPLNPNVLYFSSDDEPESFPVINGFDLDTPITGIFETSLGLVVTTETDLWRVIGDNPDYFIDKIRKGMGNLGFRACGESRLYGWATDRDGIRLFDLQDTNKITDIIRDKFDDFERTNLEHIWSTHSRRVCLMLWAFPDDDNVYTDYYVYQYGGNDDIRNGWWWTLSPPSGVELLCAEEVEDTNGDFHLYIGGNDGMLYEFFTEASDNFTNASGTSSAVTFQVRTGWIRAGALGAELEGATGRCVPEYVELRAREEDSEAHNWTVLVETADGSALSQTARDSQTLTFAFPAGQSIQRYRPQNLTGGEYLRFTVTNSETDKHVIFQGLRVYLKVMPAPGVITSSNVSGQS